MEEALTSTAGIHVQIVLHSSPYMKRQRFTGGHFIAFELYQAVAATCSCNSSCLLLYSSLRQATVASLPVTVKVHSDDCQIQGDQYNMVDISISIE